MTVLPDSIFQDCRQLTKIKLPPALTAIGKSCFHNSDIREFVVPKNISVIENQAFYNCKNLKRVVFNSQGNLEKIGMYAFAFTGISEFVAPATLRMIEQGAFSECNTLMRV